jgi:hypothetical protein
MSSGHISFAESAKEALDELRDATDMEGLMLRWRAAALVKKFGSWVANQPSPDEKTEAVNELMAVRAGVTARRVKRAKAGGA